MGVWLHFYRIYFQKQTLVGSYLSIRFTVILVYDNEDDIIKINGKKPEIDMGCWFHHRKIVDIGLKVVYIV